ncbi:MAG: DeoR/GlpR family DNA-binding transcription regulator [Kiritimatiellales bacterium]|nr:DeoR/GlpR family DNA-binding transcription regulator [Kiritimatiellales bacterium]
MKTKPTTAAARIEAIKTLLCENQSVSITHLAEQYEVSEMTIRRDLQKLEEQGEAQRTHGGALPSERMLFEFDFSIKRSENREAKRAIAAAASELIKPGHRIILDNGTTTLELAMILRDYRDITVVTPSLAVAAALQFSEGIETILLGGALRRGRPELTGIVTETILDMFSVDIAFQGSDGVGLDGSLYTEDPRVSQVDRRIRTRAAKTYVLADSSKIGKTALIAHGRLKDTEALITDSNLSKANRRALEKTGAKIIIAKEV